MNKKAVDYLLQTNPEWEYMRHKLVKMKQGSYCIHNSWGLGIIKDYDVKNNKLVIDFENGKINHHMDPIFCLSKLEILNENSILVRQKKDKNIIENLINKDPIALIIQLLSDQSKNTMYPSDLEKILEIIVGKNSFKNWWNKVRKMLIKDPRIQTPNKKENLYILKSKSRSIIDEIEHEFLINKDYKIRINLAEKITSVFLKKKKLNINIDNHQILNLLNILEETLNNALIANHISKTDILYGIFVRDDLKQHLLKDKNIKEKVKISKLNIKSIIKSSNNLPFLIEGISYNYYKRILQIIYSIYPQKWEIICINLIKNTNTKFATHCIQFLIEMDCEKLLIKSIKKWFQDKSMKPSILYWVIKNRSNKKYMNLIKEFINTELLNAIFASIELDALQKEKTKKKSLLVDILLNDKKLINDILSKTDFESSVDLAYNLLNNQGFELLTKKSLIARFIKIYPNIQKLVLNDTGKVHSNILIVSKKSFEIKKQEYDSIISTKIPEIKKAILSAKEHGDLRENSEYKMALEDQETLLSRKFFLEEELARARITNFTDKSTETVNIGHSITLKSEEGEIKTFHILGAWDSNPKKNILSYQTPLAKILLGKRQKEYVFINIKGIQKKWKIENIFYYKN